MIRIEPGWCGTVSLALVRPDGYRAQHTAEREPERAGAWIAFYHGGGGDS
jgi:hypothetical protein